MTYQRGTPAGATAEGSSCSIWSDHHHVVVVRHSSDGTPKVDVLERLPLEIERDFDARAAIYVGSRRSKQQAGVTAEAHPVAIAALKAVHTVIFAGELSAIVWLVVSGLIGRRDRTVGIAAMAVAAETAVFGQWRSLSHHAADRAHGRPSWISVRHLSAGCPGSNHPGLVDRAPGGGPGAAPPPPVGTVSRRTPGRAHEHAPKMQGSPRAQCSPA